MNNENLMDKIVSLCKRRGFIFPGSEIYGGLANSWDYGPLGVELKNNIKNLWWRRFVHQRGDMVGIDPAIIMSPKVWEASGHVKEFSDPLVECEICHERFRVGEDPYSEESTKISTEHIFSKHREKVNNETVGFKLQEFFTKPKKFNLLFKTFLGPTEDSSGLAYLRGELAQAMFVNFKNALDTIRKRLPFGIAAQGKVFRNEITPGNFIFRTREFDLMEFEYFVRAEDWENWFEYWRVEMWNWLESDLGIDRAHVHELEVSEEDRAHYSKRTIDFEYDYPFGRKELYGLAYRTDFDLQNHMRQSGADLEYSDPETGEKFIPHVVEPTFGLDRSVLVVLLDSYHEEGDRTILKLPPRLAPYKAAVFPLLANKPQLVEAARKIYDDLRHEFPVDWDERGNIGKRYYSQDEIGTPYCITVDFDSLEKGDVTVRDRNTAQQERVLIQNLAGHLKAKLAI